MSRIPEQSHDVKQRQQRAYEFIEELLDASGCPKNEWAHYSQYAVDRDCRQMFFKRRLSGAYDVLEIIISTEARMFLDSKGGVRINGDDHTFDSAAIEIRKRYKAYNEKIAAIRAALDNDAS